MRAPDDLSVASRSASTKTKRHSFFSLDGRLQFHFYIFYIIALLVDLERQSKKRVYSKLNTVRLGGTQE